jgi:hypothetical protein
MLVEVANRPQLSESLAFRGGTCLHKLVFAKAWRFSEDLDFCAIGSADVSLAVAGLRDMVHDLGGEVVEVIQADPPKRVSSTALKAFFRSADAVLQPEPGGVTIKIEVNVLETSALDRRGYDDRDFVLRGLTPLTPAAIPPIRTFTLDEILATKLRALVTRGTPQGRDLLDLWIAFEQHANEIDVGRLVEMFWTYLGMSGRRFRAVEVIDRAQKVASVPGMQEDVEAMCPEIPSGWSPGATVQMLDNRVFPAL